MMQKRRRARGLRRGLKEEGFYHLEEPRGSWAGKGQAKGPAPPARPKG
jgi:hypothetical protein